MAAPNERPTTTKKPSKPSPIVNIYLILYNIVQVVGWSWLLFVFAKHYIGGDSKEQSLWERVKWYVILFQNAALLEVVHAFIGFVKSNPIITLLQVLSRVQLVFLLIFASPAHNSFGLPMALAAWCITEIIRYGFYACNLIKFVPSILTWLRYSTFIILYPIGVTGELICLYYGQKYVRETGLFSIEMPNAVNFTFSYAYYLWLSMLIYIPFFPKLYGHMLSQRKKVLGTPTMSTDSKVGDIIEVETDSNDQDHFDNSKS